MATDIFLKASGVFRSLRTKQEVLLTLIRNVIPEDVLNDIFFKKRGIPENIFRKPH